MGKRSAAVVSSRLHVAPIGRGRHGRAPGGPDGPEGVAVGQTPAACSPSRGRSMRTTALPHLRLSNWAGSASGEDRTREASCLSGRVREAFQRRTTLCHHWRAGAGKELVEEAQQRHELPWWPVGHGCQRPGDHRGHRDGMAGRVARHVRQRDGPSDRPITGDGRSGGQPLSDIRRREAAVGQGQAHHIGRQAALPGLLRP